VPILFSPSKVFCRSCEKTGLSRLNIGYWIAFFAGSALAAFLIWDGWRSGFFGITELGAGAVIAFLCVKTFFSKAAHRCRYCDGAFVEPT